MLRSDPIDEVDMALSWTQLPPGPELAIRLSLIEWETLADRELVAAMDAARRQATWAQGRQLEAVGELARRRHDADPYGGSDTHRRICGEVSLNLTVPTGEAEELVSLAEVLPDRLPKTWAALRTGQIDYGRAAVMMSGVFALSDEAARRIDNDLIGEAVDTCRTWLRSRVKKAAKSADPEACAERTKQAKADRRVELRDNEDDTCDLVGRNLSAADAHAIRNRLTAAANAMRADGDERTVNQIRVDLYRDLLRGIALPAATRNLIIDCAPDYTTAPSTAAATGSDAPSGNASGIVGDVPSHAEADTALHTYTHNPAKTRHRPDTAGHPAPGGRRAAARMTGPAMPGVTPDGAALERADVIAAVERMIAQALGEVADRQLTELLDRARADGRLDGVALLIGQAVTSMRDALAGLVDAWCRATGDTPAGHGHHRYTPPAGMRRLIERRHATCAYPTCNRRSIHCDIDHTIPYDKGGRTCKCNLAPLCRTHHRIIKQHPSWKLAQLWPGLLIWVGPSGTWHIVTPQ